MTSGRGEQRSPLMRAALLVDGAPVAGADLVAVEPSLTFADDTCAGASW